MPYEVIDISSRLQEYRITDQERAGVEKIVHLRMLELVYLVRAFEQTLLGLKGEDLVHGPVHTSVGQEAVAAGCGTALERGDIVGSTHRAHHHFLGKVFPCCRPRGYHPARDRFTGDMHRCVERTLAEVMGLKKGWCGGRGGSMHLRNMEAGVIGTNAIVGGGIALTTGAGWAQRLRNTGFGAVVFLGDGAVNQGILLESANMAKLLNLPVTYFIENNLYAVGTGTRESSATRHLAQRALGFDMDGIVVDGMDPAAVYLLVREVREKQREGVGPVFVEAKTYRFLHHAGSRKGSAFKYRDEQEENEWLLKDPAARYPEQLKSLGVLSQVEDSLIREKAEESVHRAVEAVTGERGGRRVIPDRMWPGRDALYLGVPGGGDGGADTPEGLRYAEREDFDHLTRRTFVNVMSDTMARRMEEDGSVIVLGEEVANLGGGAYNATRAPLQREPGRVFNTPISEAGFTGLAFGASLCGIKPIVEIMFPDFALVAADQLFNQIAKLKYVYGGKVAVPLVVRTRVAAGLGYGAQHSSDLVGLYAMFRGWRIVAPSTPFDYIGLFNTAMACPDPVLVMEHHSLYRAKGEVPSGDLDYCIRLGKARRTREGTDLTVITYLRGVHLIDAAGDELERRGISVEVIDLRTLDYHSVDYRSIGESLRKTGRAAILEESPRSLGIGARVADEIQGRFFSLLKRPVGHIESIDVPLPVSRRMESDILIDEEKVMRRIVEILRGEECCGKV